MMKNVGKMTFFVHYCVLWQLSNHLASNLYAFSINCIVPDNFIDCLG
jgi:hypothetical protein